MSKNLLNVRSVPPPISSLLGLYSAVCGLSHHGGPGAAPAAATAARP